MGSGVWGLGSGPGPGSGVWGLGLGSGAGVWSLGAALESGVSFFFLSFLPWKSTLGSQQA